MVPNVIRIREIQLTACGKISTRMIKMLKFVNTVSEKSYRTRASTGFQWECLLPG